MRPAAALSTHAHKPHTQKTALRNNKWWGRPPHRQYERYKVVRTLRLTKLNSSPAQPWLRIPPPQPRLRWPWAVRMPRRSLGIVGVQRRRVRRRWSTGRNEGSCSRPNSYTWACYTLYIMIVRCGPLAIMGIHVRGAWPPREKRTEPSRLSDSHGRSGWRGWRRNESPLFVCLLGWMRKF